MMIQVEVTFFLNQYGGLRTNKAPEWPPSPARLLQAMLAGAYYGHDSRAIELARTMVRYLEAQKPPDVYAAPVEAIGKFNHFVRNPTVKRFDGEEENRVKVCNPSRLSQKSVYYVWDAKEPPPSLNAFDSLCCLGRGEDIAWAKAAIVDKPPTGLPRYVPVPVPGNGLRLNVPVAGFLDDLDVVHRTRARSELMNMITQPYALEADVTLPTAIFEFRQDDGKFYVYPTSDAARAAAQTRHAALAILKREGVGNLSDLAGHGDPRLKLHFLPLPSDIAHEHATGIRRVAVTASLAQHEAIDILKECLAGQVLTDDGGQEVCRLTEAKVDGVVRRYVGRGTEFETITPVIWWRGATKNHKVNQSRLERVARELFENANLPAPVAVSVSQPREGFFIPEHLRRLPAFHLRVRFANEVAGVVRAGLGTGAGLGIFANVAGF